MARHMETIALTFMLLHAVHCGPMHVYFLVPSPVVSLRCYFASMQTCKEALYTCGVAKFIFPHVTTSWKFHHQH